jgi:DNA polymerase elongation subunit (family B)
MSRLILDIETAGREFDTLDDVSKEYFLARADTEEEIQKAKESLSFYPLTGEVVAIGLLNPDTGKGSMYFQTPGDLSLPFEEDGITYEPGTEEEILRKFWERARGLRSIITFNGRGFDCPFILVRSAMHRIRPTKNLMPNRYSSDEHIDLMDRLTFFGSTRRRFSLDMWCRAFGITSPKEEVSGYQVSDLFRDGRYLDIARYCARDLFATSELFGYWDKYIKWSGKPY